jgi:predicted transcriptional regulator
MSGRQQQGTARRRSGELETSVLGALWAAGGPLTPGEVRGRLGGGLAYNTVHTVVTRLAAKGLVVRAPRPRGAWLPAADPAEQAARLLAGVLERSPDHGAVLQRFAATLSAADEAALRAVLGAEGDQR